MPVQKKPGNLLNAPHIWPDISEKVDLVRFQWKGKVFWKTLVWFGWFYGTRNLACHLMPNFVHTHIKPKIYERILSR